MLGKIIEYEGFVVPEEALRHGRRLANHKNWESLKQNKAPLPNKPRSFQQIEPLVSSPPHPDIDEARRILREGRF